jgi:hypothetical protein
MYLFVIVIAYRMVKSMYLFVIVIAYRMVKSMHYFIHPFGPTKNGTDIKTKGPWALTMYAPVVLQ